MIGSITRTASVCWRCGATPGDESPCTEKRGEGPPWQHDFRDRASDPWVDWPTEEVHQLALYLGLKATSSLRTAFAFDGLTKHAADMGISRATRYQYALAAQLYAQKATKRTRLLDWAMDVWEARIRKGDADAPDRSHPR